MLLRSLFCGAGLFVTFAALGQSVNSGASGTTTRNAVYTVVEQQPYFRGGMDAMWEYLGQNLRYPEEALRQRIEGKVFVNFVVSETGTLENVTVVKGPHPLLNDEAVRVIKLMPAWEPGRQVGRAVPVSYNLPITFRLPPLPPAGPRTAPEVYPPKPVGGQAALEAHLKSNLNYPEAARRQKASMLVFVQADVNEHGQLIAARPLSGFGAKAQLATNGQTKRELQELLDAAGAAFKPTHAWQPAQQKGKPAAGSVVVPVVLNGTTGSAELLPYVHLFPSEPAVPVGGKEEQFGFMAKNMRYPTGALRRQTQGEVKVLVEVDEAGQLSNATVIQSVSPELDAEALRVTALMKPMHPALERDLPVRSFVVLPFTFTIK
ncbi:TonB family protein [Hymenobacter oligotrophus]|nr:TonB family protein [Hymenobacter oligotrophus]